jgi:hypothetical protein
MQDGSRGAHWVTARDGWWLCDSVSSGRWAVFDERGLYADLLVGEVLLVAPGERRSRLDAARSGLRRRLLQVA